jgi:hypothetical protein
MAASAASAPANTCVRPEQQLRSKAVHGTGWCVRALLVRVQTPLSSGCVQPPRTVQRELRMAMTAAMKKVLSPISDAPMTPAAQRLWWRARKWGLGLVCVWALPSRTRVTIQGSTEWCSALQQLLRASDPPMALISASMKRPPAVPVMVADVARSAAPLLFLALSIKGRASSDLTADCIVSRRQRALEACPRGPEGWLGSTGRSRWT